MKQRELLATAVVPDTDRELRLYRLGDMYSIRIMGRGELMNDRAHGSERALAELACQACPADGRVLVGGLGMGFTLAAALALLGPHARVLVAELVPEVVEWNRDITGDAAGHPLADPRVEIHIGDVADPIRSARVAPFASPDAASIAGADAGADAAADDGFDAIMLDVDNGPEAILRRENDWLYGSAGLAAMRRALRPAGRLAIWSAGPDVAFSRTLARAGFQVEEHSVRGNRRKGPRHHVWVAS